MDTLLRKNKGITLIELLVTLVITGILVGAIYRTFIGQQKTYTVQEQVVDMQQIVRAAINRMMAEVRMGGFGHVEMLLPAPYGSGAGVTIGGRTYNDIINPNIPVAGAVTILYGVSFYSINGGDKEIVLITAVPASNQVTVSSLTDSQGNALFDTGDRKYVSIGGVESYAITNIAGKTLTLSGNLTYDHLGRKDHLNAKGNPVDKDGNPIIVPIYGIRAVSYQVDGTLTLLRDELPRPSTQAVAQPQPVTDNIENLQFVYLNDNGNPAAQNADIRVIWVALRARTDFSDPDYKADGGYRKRQITSSIHLKNMGLEI